MVHPTVVHSMVVHVTVVHAAVGERCNPICYMTYTKPIGSGAENSVKQNMTAQ